MPPRLAVVLAVVAVLLGLGAWASADGEQQMPCGCLPPVPPTVVVSSSDGA